MKAPYSQSKNIKVAIFLMAALLIGGALVITGNRIINPQPDLSKLQDSQASPTPKSLITESGASSTVVYGRLLGGGVQIRAVNSDGLNDSLIANLPLATKDINIVSYSQLLYIADTNDSDHGRRIVLYNLATQKEQTIAASQLGWGIDDVILSPDKSWIAWWEVKLSAKGQLLGGKSRVFTLQLNSQEIPIQAIRKNLIFDETATADTPIHYPLFFDHQNNLYSDGFIPNGGGWNRGLLRTSPTGQNQTIILADGAYNTDPILNPVDNTIVYTGMKFTANTHFQTQDFLQNLNFNEASPPGIMRQQALFPNSLLTLDLTTNKQSVLLADSSREYFDPIWSYNGQYLYLKSYKRKNNKLTDALFLKITVSTGQVTTIEDKNNMPAGLLIADSDEGFISGIPLENKTPANLGQTYGPQLSSISTGTSKNQTKLVSGPIQYIDIIKRQADKPLGLISVSSENKASSAQLASLNFKPQIDKRPQQQNNEANGIKCKDLVRQLLSQGKLGPGSSLKKGPGGLFYVKSNAYKCYDSPLYLYPKKPTKVTIKVKNAKILSSNLPYNPNIGWSVIAYPDGRLVDKGQTIIETSTLISQINYSYSSTFSPPKTGFIFAYEELPAKLTFYAKNLGLSGREISDFVDFWLNQLPEASYYFVSHFTNPSSILDFDISPKPDNFIQAIVYFKPLESLELKLDPAVFPPVPDRSGFTAVDWSGIIDD